MVKWEYLVLRFVGNVEPPDDLYNWLDNRGEDGWEAYHCERTDATISNARLFYFKRPVPTP